MVERLPEWALTNQPSVKEHGGLFELHWDTCLPFEFACVSLTPENRGVAYRYRMKNKQDQWETVMGLEGWSSEGLPEKILYILRRNANQYQSKN